MIADKDNFSISDNLTLSVTTMMLFGELIGCCTGSEKGEFAAEQGRIYQNPVLVRNQPTGMPQPPQSRFYLGPQNPEARTQNDLDSIAFGSQPQKPLERREIQVARFDQLESLRLGEKQTEQQVYMQSFANKNKVPPHLTVKRSEAKPIKHQLPVGMTTVYSLEEKENLKSRKEVLSWHDSCESALSYWQQQPEQTAAQPPRSYLPIKSPRNYTPRSECSAKGQNI
jgi:hypothetical protein